MKAQSWALEATKKAALSGEARYTGVCASGPPTLLKSPSLSSVLLYSGRAFDTAATNCTRL